MHLFVSSTSVNDWLIYQGKKDFVNHDDKVSFYTAMNVKSAVEVISKEENFVLWISKIPLI